MTTEIEKRIKSINDKELSLGAFIAIGVGALILGVNPVETAIAGISTFLSLPFFLSGLATKYRLNKKESGALSGLSAPFYFKTLSKWFDQYMENSETLTEKKYKILFLSIWLKEHHIKMEDIIGYDSEKINKITREIRLNNESKFNLYGLVYEVSIGKEERLRPYDILKEDLNSPEKMIIAKKVYEDYKDNGLLGKAFKWWGLGTAEALLVLQDYQLNEKDIINLNEIVIKRQDDNSNFMDVKDFIYDKKDADLLENLLDNQTEEKGLIVLKDFFLSLDECYNFDAKQYAERLQKKLDYIHLKNKMETELPKKIDKKPSKVKV